MTAIQLRDYQQKIVDDIKGFMRRGFRRVLAQAGTGAGKSYVIASIAQDAEHKGSTTLVLVHRTKLLKQLTHTLEGNVGVICAPQVKKSLGAVPGVKFYTRKNQTYEDHSIFLASVQTLDKRELPPGVRLVLADEAHSTCYFDCYRKCELQYGGPIPRLGRAYFVGFTATPYRTNSKQGFCQFFDCAVRGPSVSELVDRGFLTPGEIFHYKTALNLAALDVDRTGDYTVGSLIQQCGPQFRNDVVEKCVSLTPDRKAILFAVDQNSAREFEKLFKERGWSAETILGNTSETTREEIFTRFRHGETKILCSVGTLCEGFSEDTLDLVIIARPTKSLGLFQQMIGRGTRTYEGKENFYIFDFVSATKGFLEDGFLKREIDDVLDFNTPILCPSWKKQPNSEKDCENCGASIPRFARVCPYCSTAVELKEKGKKTLDFNHFPKFVKITDKKTRRNCQWIGTYLDRRFPSKSIEGVFEEYKRRHHNHLPRPEYFAGALFGYYDTGLAEDCYRHYLNRFIRNPAIIDHFLRLEFGAVGKTILLHDGTTHTREDRSQIEFDPYVYLGVEKHVTATELQQAYAQHVNSTKNSQVLNYCYDYLLMQVT